MTSQVRRVRLLHGWRRKVLAVATALIVVLATATACVLVWPVERTPAKADAIVMLAGPGDRLSVALQLAREQRAPVLVISRGWMGYGGPCPPPTPGVRTICFNPDPGNTRGEAEYVGALARRNAWHSLILVATRAQAVRAQLLFGRCFSGQVYVATAPVTWDNWPYQIAYGWGALVKAALLVRSC
ncbi:MAG TPA: hypothetical protein VGG83_03430 [Trebonia sp.]|jgi:uncharacterized SAM-binding protein YcdF (DUF218 family)